MPLHSGQRIRSKMQNKSPKDHTNPHKHEQFSDRISASYSVPAQFPLENAQSQSKRLPPPPPTERSVRKDDYLEDSLDAKPELTRKLSAKGIDDGMAKISSAQSNRAFLDYYDGQSRYNEQGHRGANNSAGRTSNYFNEGVAGRRRQKEGKRNCIHSALGDK